MEKEVVIVELEVSRGERGKALFGSCVAQLTAGLSIMMFSVCISLIREELNLSSAQVGSLGTWTLVGQALGGIAAGYFADKLGRAKVLSCSVMLITLCGFLVSTINSYWAFALLRFTSGCGLGACYYLTVVYVGEFYPTEKRGTMGSVTIAFWSLGYVVASVMSGYVLGSIGWRGLFRLASCTFIFGVWMFFALKDAPSYLSTKIADASAKEKKKNQYAEIMADPKLRKTMIVWSSSRIFYLFAYYGAVTWLPNYIQTSVGLNLRSAGWFTGANYFMMICGTLFGGWIADKLGRKITYIPACIATAIMAPILAFAASPSNLLFLLLAWGFLYGLPTGSSATFMGESWPNHLRGTGVGTSYNVGRIGSWMAPIIVGAMIDFGSAPMGIATLGVGYFISALILIPFVKEKEYDTSKVVSTS
jgi:AAHS family cis,cis-muconate transporter-like MFS transporter